MRDRVPVMVAGLQVLTSLNMTGSRNNGVEKMTKKEAGEVRRSRVSKNKGRKRGGHQERTKEEETLNETGVMLAMEAT